MIERLIEASAPLSGDGDLLLASKSETRARLLAGAGLAFRQEPASIDEAALKDVLKAAGVTGGQAALALAERKAALLSDRQRAAFVIGADQILVCDNLWYDKPADLAAARAQLLALRNRSHRLHAAVCVARGGAILWRHVAQARLTMRDFSTAFLDRYLAAAGEAVLSSVGAYQIEGLGAQLFSAVAGDGFAILGLPLIPLLAFLRENGVVQR